MGALMRAFDWASTPLGPPKAWPMRLRTYVELMLVSKQPMYLGWTRELIALYNDAYHPILGADKHPGALGARTADIFGHDGYPGHKRYFDAVLERGESIALVDILVPLVRHSYLEECYFDVSYTPIQGDVEVEGLFATVNETSERVIGTRRTRTLAALAAQLLDLSDVSQSQVAAAFVQSVEENPHDLPFALLYVPSAEGSLELSASAGLDEGQLRLLNSSPQGWRRLGEAEVVPGPALTVQPWPEPVTRMALLPLTHPDEGAPLGLLVVGLNPRKHPDDPYRDFLGLLSSQVASALRGARLSGLLQEQNAELEARTKMLEAFGELTRDLSVQSDPLRLIHRVQGAVLGLLPDGFSQYYESEGERWVIRSQVGQASTPELQALVGAGLPFRETPNLLIPWQSGEAHYREVYDHAADHLTGSEAYPGATVTLPIVVGGQPRGVLGFALLQERQWSRADRALFETVTRSLNLALERADQARDLQEQKVEVESRNRALEAFAQLSRDLISETDRYILIQRAQEIVLTLLPSGYAVYYELEGGLWRVRSQVGSLGNEELQALVDVGMAYKIPTLLTPWTTRRPLYQDVYAQGTDTPAEMVRHIQAVVTLPLLVQETPVGLFVIGLFHRRRWTETDRAVLETTLRSLTLALERAEHTRQLTAQRDTLDARTVALGDANEELEAFAYSVSHDLRTPVRHIAGFNNLLRKSLGDPQKAARYLDVIDQAAGRMNTLIDAMLDLSQTARQPLHPRRVDLEALVTHVRAELVPDILERQITWKVGPLPLVMGDQDLLRQVLVNLLSNALKYTRAREQAVIEVWAEEHVGAWAVFVRDNGAGFDPRYAEKLFGVFQRLHRQEEFEGTGVGLANVRRIVTRHGGTVFAQGRPGEGATFGFTLPRQP